MSLPEAHAPACVPQLPVTTRWAYSDLSRLPSNTMKSILSLAKILLVRFLSLLHLIDKDFYLKRYPDVATAKIDPVEHYVSYGFREGRSPNRWLAACKDGAKSVPRSIVRRLTGFDANYYLKQYPDVASARLESGRTLYAVRILGRAFPEPKTCET